MTTTPTPAKKPKALKLRKVEPFEARDLPDLPDEPLLNTAVRDLATAVCGFPYPGDKSTAIVETVRFLRANPAHAAACGIGTP